MKYRGVLKKMTSELSDPINYFLETDEDILHVNQLIGKDLGINFETYECLNCGLEKKIFRQGFCYDCFSSSARVGDWIMRPELSKAHLGIEDRDLAYEEKVQLQPHIVYLAASSGVKVGVTRKSQVPTRWIDQGASRALSIVEVPNRYLAGIAEVALKDYLSDKTDWRKMLKNVQTDADLVEVFEQVKQYLPKEVLPYILEPTVLNLDYPVKEFPIKINSQNLNKTPSLHGKLAGVKGQYLIFEDGQVFNVRNNEGYVVELTLG